MPKPEWGVKRACPSCSARFYDLKRTPIVCPECDAPFETPTKDKAASLKADLERAKSAEAAQSENLVDDDDTGDQADSNEDDALLDDDDKDGGNAGPVLSDEESDDEPVKFADNALLDDDDDDDIGDVKKSGGDET